MKIQSLFFLVPITLLAAENQITKYPPVFALDIGDEYDLQILQRVTTTDCIIWKTERRNKKPLYIKFSSGQWEIIENIGRISRKGRNCSTSAGNLLFHQIGENPSSEGWYDDTNKIPNVTLTLYALQECLTYTGAFVESEFATTSLNKKQKSCKNQEVCYKY